MRALFCLILLAPALPAVDPPPARSYDLVVAGGTASGVAAAIAAAEEGMRVALVEPTHRLGGMVGNGVSKTDIGMRETLNGLFEKFRLRVKERYAGDPLCEDGFKYEPRVAQAIIRAMVDEQPNIAVFLKTRVTGVRKMAAGRVTGVVAQDETGKRMAFDAPITIDATDEGDVAAWAGAQYRLGREARSPDEPHAGVIYLDRGGVNPRDTSVKRPYRILPETTGEADGRTQAFSYLMTLKDYGPGPRDRKHVLREPPPGYDPAYFRHTRPWEKSWAVFSGRLPGNKHEVNQYPFGVELPGGSDRWCEASYEERLRIAERHKHRALGYLYHLQHVEGKYNLGLADDEYTDNGNFPVQLYIRQGRRILGDYILSEADINPFLKGDGVRPPFLPDSIATGTFPIDVHPVSDPTSPDRPDMGEGELFLPEVTAPFQVPYRCLTPAGVDGLLVSQAVSSTHIGFQAVRLEAVRMNMGMAAGYAAAQARKLGRDVRRIDVARLQARLIEAGAMVYLFRDVPPGSPYFRAVQTLGARDGFRGFDDYTFRPRDPATRAQIAEALVRSLGIPVSITAAHYTDMPKHHPAFRYVETLYDRDALKPWAAWDAPRFEPDAQVTAGELEALLAILAGRAAPARDDSTPLTRGEAAQRIAREIGGGRP